MVVTERQFRPNQRCGSAILKGYSVVRFETRTNTLAFGTGRLI